MALNSKDPYRVVRKHSDIGKEGMRENSSSTLAKEN